MTVLGQTILKCALPQIRTIDIITINGVVMKAKANSFFPWKMVVSDDVVAYMCCVDIAGTVTTNAKNSVEISKNEYDRLVEKFKVYQENNTCMIEGFQDYSEPPEMPNEPWLGSPVPDIRRRIKKKLQTSQQPIQKKEIAR